MSIEYMLKTLLRLSANHPDYGGTIEHGGIDGLPRLRYFKSSSEMIEECRLEWNWAVRSLDEIAPDIIAIVESHGVLIPPAETYGASVMYWLLKDGWKSNRVSTSCLTNAFEKIHYELTKFESNSTSQLPNEGSGNEVKHSTLDSIAATFKHRTLPAVDQCEVELKALLESKVVDSTWKLEDLAVKMRRAKRTVAATPTWKSWQSKK